MTGQSTTENTLDQKVSTILFIYRLHPYSYSDGLIYFHVCSDMFHFDINKAAGRVIKIKSKTVNQSKDELKMVHALMNKS